MPITYRNSTRTTGARPGPRDEIDNRRGHRFSSGKETLNMRAFNKAMIWFFPTVIAVVWPGLYSLSAAETNTLPSVRVAGIVLKWIRADKEANFRRVEPMIREAAAHGAKIVCTTECFLDGY